MEEACLYNGRCLTRLILAVAVIRTSEAEQTIDYYGLVRVKLIRVWVKVCCYHNSKESTILKYISNYPVNMEMEQLSQAVDVSTELLHSKPLLELNPTEEVNQHKRKSDDLPDLSKHLSAEKRAKFYAGSENSMARSSYPRDDRFVYGNPKETIKPAPVPPDVFDTNNVLDLSWKGPRSEEDKTKPEGTYHNFHRNNQSYPPDAFPRSNLEIKLVNTPKRPTTVEQLQIAKLQQQQRRSVQQQQKMLQQMRRSLDAANGRPPSVADTPKKSSRDERAEMTKDDFHPSMLAPLFPPNPYYDPTPAKELPDGHPILPLLDPVYFSALYNAHGYMPPSSPSIAAAFISTLQDALPKLSMMFPNNATPGSSPVLPQKGNENPN